MCIWKSTFLVLVLLSNLTIEVAEGPTFRWLWYQAFDPALNYLYLLKSTQFQDLASELQKYISCNMTKLSLNCVFLTWTADFNRATWMICRSQAWSWIKDSLAIYWNRDTKWIWGARRLCFGIQFWSYLWSRVSSLVFPPNLFDTMTGQKCGFCCGRSSSAICETFW